MNKPLLGWVLGLALLGTAPARGEEIVVVVHRDAPVSRLSAQEIKDIYLGERAYWGNQRINPISYGANKAIQDEFLRRVVHTDPNTYKRYWIKRIFREGGVPPARIGSGEELINSVANTQGAIGFLFARELPAAGDRVKAVYHLPD
ncbi:MAG: hypothetical protein HZA24_04050 [Nitrospirae bacterium]|nr:hypothetical protein [Nitrospirota bacterium]